MFIHAVMTVNKEEDTMNRIEVAFDKNQTVKHLPEGIKYRIPLNCGLQLSVICTDFSYGGSEGLYEIAIMNPRTVTLVDVGGVIHGFDFDDVVGFLTEDEVRDYIKEINQFDLKTLAPSEIILR